MTGYRDKSEVFGRRDRMSWGEWLTLGVAVLMALAILSTAFTGRPGWYHRLGIAPVGITEFMFAWLFFARARSNGAGERFTPRQLRGAAYIFVILGVATVALGLITHS